MSISNPPGKLFTKEEVIQLEEDAFKAAQRRYTSDQIGTIEYFIGGTEPYYPPVYKTFKDYQLSVLR